MTDVTPNVGRGKRRHTPLKDRHGRLVSTVYDKAYVLKDPRLCLWPSLPMCQIFYHQQQFLIRFTQKPEPEIKILMTDVTPNVGRGKRGHTPLKDRHGRLVCTVYDKAYVLNTFFGSIFTHDNGTIEQKWELPVFITQDMIRKCI